MTTLSNTIAIPGTSTPVRHNVTSVCNNATAVGPMFTPAPLKETEPDEVGLFFPLKVFLKTFNPKFSFPEKQLFLRKLKTNHVKNVIFGI